MYFPNYFDCDVSEGEKRQSRFFLNMFFFCFFKFDLFFINTNVLLKGRNGIIVFMMLRGLTNTLKEHAFSLQLKQVVATIDSTSTACLLVLCQAQASCHPSILSCLPKQWFSFTTSPSCRLYSQYKMPVPIPCYLSTCLLSWQSWQLPPKHLQQGAHPGCIQLLGLATDCVKNLTPHFGRVHMLLVLLRIVNGIHTTSTTSTTSHS